ncbi:MAG: HNH/ENDO VII family nuclease [Clostridiales bacterium]|nr:HNH/ENDO VII family nuclease [Clostridiales bacterium]
MKKLLSIVICGSILLTSCAVSSPSQQSSLNTSSSSDSSQIVTEQTTTEPELTQLADYGYSYSDEESANQFRTVQDDDLLSYMEDVVYYDMISDMDSSEYYVESVQAVYVSQEYIEELTYNSQENIYFGYHLSDIRNAFGETPWFFTVDENGQTIVTEYTYKEFEFEFSNMLRDLAIGAGVILVCATVSLVTAPALPAVSMIMMVSAKTATTFALSSGAIGAVSSGLVTYVQTGDMNQSLQSAMDGGAKGFKIGAITGAVVGGAKEIAFLKSATATKYLSMNEAAIIQRQTKWPADVISEIHTMEEYKALSDANLQSVLVGNKSALIPSDVDLNLVDSKGLTNLQRMEKGLAPIDKLGNSYELHHIGQEAEGTLAMLTREQHDNIALHGFKKISEINRSDFDKQRAQFYKDLFQIVTKGI